MHSPYFAWLEYEHKSEDYIADVCNRVEQFQLEWTGGLDKSKGALGWTGGQYESKGVLGVD
jgi:hypothetical protein